MFLSKQDFKYLLWSRSWRFTRAARFGNLGPIATCDWRGYTLHYRPGASDPHLIYKILFCTRGKAEHVFPAALRAGVIFDVGANIGAASVLLATRFPNSRIFSFEPIPENFELLKRNVAALPNVTPVPLALSSRSGSREVISSPDKLNLGGYSFFQQGASKETPRTQVVTATPAEFMRAEGLEAVDLIKVDTEGAEYEILTSFETEVLERVTWIVGELHGERDFELLAYLTPWFDISAKNSLGKPQFIFNACNKNALAQIVA